MKITPKAIKAYLDQFVFGQEEAKKAVAVSGFQHYLRYMNNTLTKDAAVDPLFTRKSNIMLVGPSGVGKTFIVKKLAEFLQLPFHDVSAASLSNEGYIGTSLEDHIEEYVNHTKHAFGADLEYGIFFIDEIDKLAVNSEKGHSDSFTLRKQYSMLRLIEGIELQLAGRKSDRAMSDGKRKFKTGNLLFIFAGNFREMRETRKENKKRGIGFIHEDKPDKEKELHEEIIKAGIIPELAGRISEVVELMPLTKEILYESLVHGKESPLESYRNLLTTLDIDLEISDEELMGIAERCSNSEIGARGIFSEVDKLIRPLLFDIDEVTE